MRAGPGGIGSKDSGKGSNVQPTLGRVARVVHRAWGRHTIGGAGTGIGWLRRPRHRGPRAPGPTRTRESRSPGAGSPAGRDAGETRAARPAPGRRRAQSRPGLAPGRAGARCHPHPAVGKWDAPRRQPPLDGLPRSLGRGRRGSCGHRRGRRDHGAPRAAEPERASAPGAPAVRSRWSCCACWRRWLRTRIPSRALAHVELDGALVEVLGPGAGQRLSGQFAALVGAFAHIAPASPSRSPRERFPKESRPDPHRAPPTTPGAGDPATAPPTPGPLARGPPTRTDPTDGARPPVPGGRARRQRVRRAARSRPRRCRCDRPRRQPDHDRTLRLLGEARREAEASSAPGRRRPWQPDRPARSPVSRCRRSAAVRRGRPAP